MPTTSTVTIAGKDVRLTNLRKPFWRALGITKGDLLRYYADVAPALLPHLAARAMVMKRYPNGADGQVLLHEARARAAAGLDRDLRDRARVRQRHRVPDRATTCRRCCGSSTSAASTSIRGTRAATTSTAPTTCTSTSTRSPTRRSRTCARARCILRDELAALGMPLYVKTTGSKGVHVYVPIVRGPTQKEVWTFAKRCALALAKRAPAADDRRIPDRQAPRGPRARRLQPERVGTNARVRLFAAAEAACDAYRRRVTWDELARGATIEDFRIDNVPARIARAATCGRRSTRSAAASTSRRCSRRLLMTLPLAVDYPPMEAKPVDALPEGDAWQYEPKWDGFRCLAFKRRRRRRAAVEGRASRSTRYFPEIVAALHALPVDALRARRRARRPRRQRAVVRRTAACASIPPRAACRSSRTSIPPSTSCSICSWMRAASRSSTQPLAERRAALERFAARAFADAPAFRLSPATRDAADVEALARSARRGHRRRRSPSASTLAYRSGERTGMQKIQAHAHRGLRRRRVSLRREGARSWARCCSACTTTKGCCTTSASRRTFRRASARR